MAKSSRSGWRLRAAHRYLIGHNLPEKEGLLRFAIPGSPDWQPGSRLALRASKWAEAIIMRMAVRLCKKL